MATGVKLRDEETSLTRTDLETIQDAMKHKKFREMLAEYCEEVRDPANQALYQKEMIQLEKERGYDVTFINPKGGYVIKTSVAGDRKAFINICSNENVAKPSYRVQTVNEQKGMNWQIPYSMIPPREDYNHKKERCVIYDVVFHPDTLRMAEVNKQFRELVNNTALDGLKKAYNIHLDNNNLRFPKSYYKGMVNPAVIRKEDPNYKPPTEEETEHLSEEVLEKLYPQCTYTQEEEHISKETEMVSHAEIRKTRKDRVEFSHSSNNGYTIPKYVIKQQKNVDFQDFTYHKDSKQYSAIPSHIAVEINLPLLSSTKDCKLDVKEKSLYLTSEKPAKYKLNITFPYVVDDECGNAKFDKTKHMLIVTLPVIKKKYTTENTNSLKVDSGVESEETSGSQSDDERELNSKDNLIVELSSTTVSSSLSQPNELTSPKSSEITFLDPSLGYILPPYTHNVLDDTVAFTFHVKNTEPTSVHVQKNNGEVYIKFTTIGSGFVPVHYAALIVFDASVKFDNATGEAWDNNVILQLDVVGNIPQNFMIGLNKDSMTHEDFDVSHVQKNSTPELKKTNIYNEEGIVPVVEVTNLGTETNIVVSSNNVEEYDEDDLESPTSPDEKEIVWTDTGSSENGAKSILRKSMMRSFSESSVGDVASSMDYISSDCIPEESSLKKTVRFNDVIARQFYRYNSSIEGQKKKNQRKKSKKRSLERRKSESEAEDDVTSMTMTSKPRLKSVLKQRRDSGLADTSDAETELKNTPAESDPSCDAANNNGTFVKQENDNEVSTLLNIVNNNVGLSDPAIWESGNTGHAIPKIEDEVNKPVTCDNIKHKTDLYNPDKLNKGQYLEVSFKNDLIFDLDM